VKRVIQALALIFMVLWVTTQPVLTQGNAANRGATTNDWPAYGGTTLSWRYSALNQINANNVTKLAPVWMFQSGDYADGMQSTPVVADGVLYISTARSFVFAIDGATGKVLWEYKYQPAPGNTIASALANEFTEAVGDLYTSALIELGLILFLITSIVLALSKVLLIRLARQEGGRA